MSEQKEIKNDGSGKGAAPAPEVTPADAKGLVAGKAKQNLAGLRTEVAGEGNDWEASLTHQQKKALEELRVAKNSEERVKVFAKVADDIGLDPLISLVPELGDAGSSIVSGLYLLFEARKAGLGSMDYLKIIGLQGADIAVGAIPVIGDVADYFFKANKWSTKGFETKTKELVEKARKAGVPEDKIQQLMLSAERWPQMAQKAVGLYGRYKKAGMDAEPKANNTAAS